MVQFCRSALDLWLMPRMLPRSSSPLAALFERSFADAGSHSGRVSGISAGGLHWVQLRRHESRHPARDGSATLRRAAARTRPSHMQTYASAAQKITQTIAGVVARELQIAAVACAGA